jgi:replicative superfamily II helicase
VVFLYLFVCVCVALGVCVCVCVCVSVLQGVSELSVAAFRQMSGRAGRLGLDTSGEAVLMLPNSSQKSKDLATHLVTAPMPALLSSLHVSICVCAVEVGPLG